MKVEKATNGIEFLKKNPDYNYQWVNAEEDICINNAVSVAGKYYIGRTTSGANTYLGRVDMGENGMKHENEHGLEIVTNHYQVLTCVEKSCGEVVVPGGELFECKKNVTKLEKEVVKAGVDLKGCEVSAENTRTLLDETKISNNLLTEMLAMKKIQLENCQNAPKPQTTQAPPVTNRPVTIRPHVCPPNNEAALNRQIQNLENDKTELTQQLQAAKDNCKPARGGGGNEAQLTQLRTALADAQAGSRILQDQLSKLVAQIGEADGKCKGVSGCLRAMKDVKAITNDEHTTLMLEITRLLPDDGVEDGTKYDD